ncbi:MAG TPA: tetratricopeptide repeat protein [Alphaproteobacteria bacterium]|nr:tetratricopeptide repeat protein [Alphaproteobacteria bacterium]
MGLFFGYGVILQVIAAVHFIRRRPDGYWIWVILIGGGIGALAYIIVEMVPDLGLLPQYVRIVSHRGRIKQLEMLVLDNPSAGNYEELADLYFEQKKYARAKDCYDRAISSRTDSPDPFYRRALCLMALGDFKSATADLERVYQKDRNYDYQRAAGLLAHAWDEIRDPRAGALFTDVLETSTLSETQFNYALFLARQGQAAEAKQWAQRVLTKKHTMPRYLKRRERPWFRAAATLLKKLPA